MWGAQPFSECVQSAVKGVEQGYVSLRLAGFWPGSKLTATQEVTQIAEQIERVREAIGFDIDLGIECHRNFMPEEAITLATTCPLSDALFEDPLAPESLEAMEYVARHVHIPMATGERFYNIYQFKDLIDRKIVSLIRCDPSLAGGYTQCKKIAGMAEAAFIGIFPHLMGSPVNIAAFVQFDASIPKIFLHENYIGSDVFNDLSIIRSNGRVAIFLCRIAQVSDWKFKKINWPSIPTSPSRLTAPSALMVPSCISKP